MKEVLPFSIGLLLLAGIGCAPAPGPVTAAPPPPVAKGPASVPAGSVLALQVVDTIDASAVHAGQTYAAVVSRDIEDGAHRTILPSGSPVTLILLPGRSAGTVELGIATVGCNGNLYFVRSAQVGLPGAPLGTFLEGLSGTPAAPPGGQGLLPARGMQVAGPWIWIPADSVLTFRLNAPLIFVGSGA